MIADGQGGARDSVSPLVDTSDEPPTGIWFDEQTPDCLATAVERFEKNESCFDATEIRAAAERFAPDRFIRELQHQIELAKAPSRERR